MKKVLILCGLMMAVLLVSMPAQAQLIIDNWTFNLGGVPGQGLSGTIANVNEVTYNGLAHVQVTDTNANGVPNLGERFVVDGLLVATSFVSTTGIIPTPGLNSTYEMTMRFSVGGEFTSVNGTNINFTHISTAATDGLLQIFVDNITDGTKANKTTGTGFLDGAQIAQFQIVPGKGGVFHLNTLDGSDDALFSFMSGSSGVLFDANGNDLITKGILQALITDSNFDADPDKNGTIDTPTPSQWPFPRTGSGVLTAFMVEEDGSARLVVPEPGTIVLLGAGLLGLGFFARKRRK